MLYKSYILNSLETVFLDSKIKNDSLESIRIFQNEAASFQLAFMPEREQDREDTVDINVEIECEIKDAVSVYMVENVPATRVGYSVSDDWFLRKAPGLYPDCLKAHPQNRFTFPVGLWKSLWININEKLDIQMPKNYSIKIKLFNRKAKQYIAEKTVNFTVMKGVLPKQKIITTNWMHYDCISHFSGTKPFSKEFYKVAKKYIRLAVLNGQNMLFLPAFTPPLDTPVNEERMTVQLVDVKRTDGVYSFDFSRLKEFIETALECGIEYFEHSHLYTQWGAAHAPKIVVNVDGKKKKLFGWHTDAHSDEYKDFLHAYLTSLKEFLKENGYEKRFFFHISDEPCEDNLESYTKASSFIQKELKGYPIGDALCEYRFYENGLVQTPIAITRTANDFIGRVDSLWLYYTGMESNNAFSNRLIGMPQERSRILGIQLYYYNIKGFLHWAFNAHHNMLSRKIIDPHFSSDMDSDFVAGTSYLVYPNKNDVEMSVRLMTFRDQMQDTRAFLLLESYTDRETVCNLIRKHIPDISLNCRVSADTLLALRNEVNAAICSFEQGL